MGLSQANISSNTPMGATLIPGAGATFKVWGPLAQRVYLNGTFSSGASSWVTPTAPVPDPDFLLTKDASGYWTGFLPGVVDGDQYKYYVTGQPGGSTG